MYGSETSERVARTDLALIGLVVMSVFYFNVFDVPLWVTTTSLILYGLLVLQPTLRDTIQTIFFFWINVFFREIGTRGRHYIPSTGPIVFVIAPHANQMLDPIVVMMTCGRAADIGFLAAAKTVRSRQFGWLARSMSSIPVERPQDLAEKRPGNITSKGDRVFGIGTDFTKLSAKSSVMAKGEIMPIKEIVGPTELVLKSAFASDIEEPVAWKEVPHVEQNDMYEAVYSHLAHGNAFGIFPEGGSHDRPELLPLKAGAAIMALGAMAKYPNLNVKVVPVGLNYFQGDRFRSRAYVDYGEPIQITPEMVEAFKQGGEAKRDVVTQLMDTIKESLDVHTLTASDYDTLKVVWCARRLYQPTNQVMNPRERLKVSHMFLEGYKRSKDHPVIQELTSRIQEYNLTLEEHGVHDHQVGCVPESAQRARQLLFLRLWLLVVYLLVAIPGGLIWLPLWLVSFQVSEKKKKEALAGSIVKLEGKDVVGTWKVMTAAGLAPLLLVFYCTVVCIYFQSLNAVVEFLYVMAPCLYVSVRAYEQIPRLYRSVRVLWTVLEKDNDGLELRTQRAGLKDFVRKIVDEDLTGMRSEVDPNFDINKQKELRHRYSFSSQENVSLLEELRRQ